VQNQELDPSVEVAHLRRLLDTQPVCLMRLAADGTVLAANDAALALLGVASGAGALGRNFANWVPSDQRERWRAFTVGVVQGGPASIECELVAQSGDRHPMLFHGVPLTEHPDGVVSMAVSARAVAGQRQLETAIVELEERLLERDAERIKARARLAEAEDGRRQLAEKVDMLEARLRAREAGSEDERQLRQLRADLEARDEALAAADAARRTAEANGAKALADVRQLEVALEEFAARQQQVTEERAAERQRARQMAESAAARHEQELTDALHGPERELLTVRLKEREAAVRTLEQREQEARAQRDALQARLEEALGTCRERDAALHQLERAHTDLAAAHAAATAELDRLVSALREHAGRLAALANGGARAGGGPAAADGAVPAHAPREEGRA
jgi:PAS domain S-box-containing protein